MSDFPNSYYKCVWEYPNTCITQNKSCNVVQCPSGKVNNMNSSCDKDPSGCTEENCCIEEGEPSELEPEPAPDCTQITLQEQCDEHPDFCYWTGTECKNI